MYCYIMNVDYVLYEHLMNNLKIRDKGPIIVSGNNTIKLISVSVADHPFMKIGPIGAVRNTPPNHISILAGVPMAIPQADTYGNIVSPRLLANAPNSISRRRKWKKEHQLSCNTREVLGGELISIDLCEPSSIKVIEFYSNYIITLMRSIIIANRSGIRLRYGIYHSYNLVKAATEHKLTIGLK